MCAICNVTNVPVCNATGGNCLTFVQQNINTVALIAGPVIGTSSIWIKKIIKKVKNPLKK